MYILYINIFYKFFKKFLLNGFYKKNNIICFYKKKNLFFKKKNFKLNIVSKRLSLVLRKRKKLKSFKTKKLDKGNFFLKKFFFKILLKSRKFFKNFFYFNKKTRQKRITKFILSRGIFKGSTSNVSCEYSLFNVLLRSRLFFFNKDVFKFIKSGLIFLNGKTVSDSNLTVSCGDCIQLVISNYYYRYINFSRKILKKKLALYKFNTWRFFKQKFFRKKKNLKPKKKKMPKYIHLFYMYKLNTPKTLEIDFLTLSIFILKKESIFLQSSYYINKPISFKLFSLYNFKKIN